MSNLDEAYKKRRRESLMDSISEYLEDPSAEEEFIKDLEFCFRDLNKYNRRKQPAPKLFSGFDSSDQRGSKISTSESLTTRSLRRAGAGRQRRIVAKIAKFEQTALQNVINV